jgi:hypothetical protein
MPEGQGSSVSLFDKSRSSAMDRAFCFRKTCQNYPVIAQDSQEWLETCELNERRTARRAGH